MREYQAACAHRGDGELAWYRQQASLQDAIREAGMARQASGNRHPHQYRIRRRALQQATAALLAAPLPPSPAFDELYAAVDAAMRPIRGIGELMVYDTSRRIGAYLGIEPERVYLHAGTRRGARALGLRVHRAFVEVKELPPEFAVLTPAQIEDCLCICEDDLAKLRGAR